MARLAAILLCSVIVGLGIAVAVVRHDNAELRALASELQFEQRTRYGQVEALNRKLLAEVRTPTSAANASSAKHGRTPAAGGGEQPAVNPSQVMPLESFRNVGRATPAAAFQTAVWAMTTGDEGVLADCLALSDRARVKLEALIAGLPEPERARYTPPEKIVGLLLSAGLLLDGHGLEVGGAEYRDAAHAVLHVRPPNGRDDPFELELGTGGWRLTVGEDVVELIGRFLQAPRPAEPRRTKAPDVSGH